MKRIYIFTGKGGVGKSSIATAHAIKSAGEGVRTLLVSTDMAHNLGDIFGRKLGADIETISRNLDVYEIAPEYVMEHEFPEIGNYLGYLLSGEIDGNGGGKRTKSRREPHGDSKAVQEGKPHKEPTETNNGLQELCMIPGMEELFSLLRIAELYDKEEYERIIVDCAPTGETLSLLKFPELLSWYMEKLFPIGKVGVRILEPISKAAFKVEMPNKAAMNDIEKLYVKLAGLQELLKNRDVTSIRIVTTPEKMVVEETKRNYMYMNLYDFNVDGLYINRILPKDIGNPFFEQWLDIQQGYISLLKDTFAALPIYEVPWYDEELKGRENIERIVADVLADDEVFAARVIAERECFRQVGDGYQLEVFLPGAKKEEIDLYQAATDIVIKAGNFKRNIPLPNILRSYEVAGAKFEEGKLRIRFEKVWEGSGEHA